MLDIGEKIIFTSIVDRDHFKFNHLFLLSVVVERVRRAALWPALHPRFCPVAMEDQWRVDTVDALKILVDVFVLLPMTNFPDLPKKLHICVLGGTDLAHPEVHTDFNRHVPLNPFAERVRSSPASASFFLVSLMHLLKSNRVNQVARHTLDGLCIMNAFKRKQALDPLQDYTLLILSVFLVWFRRLGQAGNQKVTDAYLLFMCYQGKHRSMYVAKLVALFLHILKAVLNLDIVIDFEWVAGPRVERDLHGEESDTRQHSRCLTDIGAGWTRFFARRGPAKFLFFECTDGFYLDRFGGEGDARALDVQRCLNEMRLPPLADGLRTLFHGLERCLFNFVMKISDRNFLRSWHFFVRQGCFPLWPYDCSLCTEARGHWAKNIAFWFAPVVEALQRQQGDPPQTATAVRKRPAWADLCDDDSDEDFVAEDTSGGAAGSSGTASQSYSASSSQTLPSSKKAAAARSTSLGTAPSPKAMPQIKGSVGRSLLQKKERQAETKKHKVRFSDDDPQVKRVPDDVHWRLEVDLELKALLSFQQVKLTEDDAQRDCLLQVTDGHRQKFRVAASKASADLVNAARSLVEEPDVQDELVEIYKLIRNSGLPFPEERTFVSPLQEMQFYIFLHMLSILVDSEHLIQFGVSALFLHKIGEHFKQKLSLDMQELVARYLYILYLAKPVEPNVWGTGCFGLLLTKGRVAPKAWWMKMQDIIHRQSDRPFCQEYCCTIGVPNGGPTGTSSDMSFADELRVIAERYQRDCMRVAPEMPEHRFWLYHDTLVSCEFGLAYPRVLQPLRSSAPGFEATWGANDGQAPEVRRHNLVRDTHVFLEVHECTEIFRDSFGSEVHHRRDGACVPDDLMLDELLGRDFEKNLCRTFAESRLPRPWWLPSACGVTTRAVADEPVAPAAESETANCLAAVQYQILGGFFMSSLRPDNVMHPHLRAHFEYHVGRLLAFEIVHARTFRVSVLDFLLGCGVKFQAGEGWQQRVVEKRYKVTEKWHTLAVHTAWGDKCRVQRFQDEDDDRIYLVAMACQQQTHKTMPCFQNLEMCGCGAVCNLRHGLNEKHARQLMVHAFQYLQRADMARRGRASDARGEDGLGFIQSLLEKMGYQCPENEQYHLNPERRLQLFHQPRWFPRFYSKEWRARLQQTAFEAQAPCPDEEEYRCFSAAERQSIKDLVRAQNHAQREFETLLLNLNKPPSTTPRSNKA